VLHAPAGDDACCLPVLFPCLKEVDVLAVEDRGEGVLIKARTTASAAACPGCGTSSVRVHSRYQRVLRDLAVCGRPVELNLRVRRFFCEVPGCLRAIFVEQVDGLTSRHARRTPALRVLLTSIGVRLAGRAGARMAAETGVPVSRSTLLRIVRALPDPHIGQVTVLGVDDFAKRRGNSYGTVLVNMDGHRPIDLLDDRTADALAVWLKAHPGVEVICRDRAGAYADGARKGAPAATQVADRWHLWHNLGDALEKTVRAHRTCLNEALPDKTPDEADCDADEDLVERSPLADSYGDERPIVARFQERYAQVQELRAQGDSLNSISRDLGLAFRTVQRFAYATSVDDLLAPSLARASKLDPFKPYLIQRWNEGCTNAGQLHEELKKRGWTGSLRAVQGYLRPLRPFIGRQKVRAAPVLPPKPRRITGWIMSHPDRVTPDDQVRLDDILNRCPQLTAATQQVRAFATMMNERQGHQLDDWISITARIDAPHLAAFATGLRRDHAAVTAGLTLPYSSGAVEGTVNKIKFLKRQMFGRANFDLLRKRVLLAT
jgi:transposase